MIDKVDTEIDSDSGWDRENYIFAQKWLRWGL